MRKHGLMMVAATILIIMVSSCCANDVRHEPVLLPVPVESLLPAVAADEVACLDDDAYARLVERERLRKEFGDDCAAIIDANNAGVNDER